MSQEQIKDILDTFRTVFNAAVYNNVFTEGHNITGIVEYKPHHDLSDLPHGRIPHASPIITNPLPTMYALQRATDSWPVDGLDAVALPFDISSEIGRGVLKWNRCDWSVYSLLPLVRAKLGSVGAKAEWVQLVPKPKGVIVTPNRLESYVKAVKGYILHSVYLVTSADGKEYIADFTIEQFGYPASQWFYEKEVYFLECVADPDRLQIKDPGLFRDMMLLKGLNEHVWCMKMREFCRTLDWVAIERIEREEREKWVWQNALEALKSPPVTPGERQN